MNDRIENLETLVKDLISIINIRSVDYDFDLARILREFEKRDDSRRLCESMTEEN